MHSGANGKRVENAYAFDISTEALKPATRATYLIEREGGTKRVVYMNQSDKLIATATSFCTAGLVCRRWFARTAVQITPENINICGLLSCIEDIPGIT